MLSFLSIGSTQHFSDTEFNNCKSARYLCLDNKQAPLEDSDRDKNCTKDQTRFPSFTQEADSEDNDTVAFGKDRRASGSD